MGKRYVDADTGKPHSFARPHPYKLDVTLTNTWANKVYAILRKDAPKWEGLSFMPKGEVQ